MMKDNGVWVGSSDIELILLYERANRHGIVAGATGTGKTVTLQVLAESFSKAGVPVFAADIKGDLSGIAAAGTPGDKIKARAAQMGVTLNPEASPTVFWDLWGEKGHPIRATISDLGPLLLARLFELNEVQEGVLNIAFHVADKEGLLLLDLKDLRALLNHVSENAKTISAQYGQVTAATIGTIQRQILTLENQGGDQFFGEPALRLEDLMRTDIKGRGMVNLLAADKLMASPRLYSTFLLWLLSELFEQLPEVGDPPKPRLVFFFDEAHLLFNEAPKALLEKIEQVVRLIRSKGVGIYFITQNPADIPDTVLAQLGNRIQHALRAYTPSEQKGLKAAADSFRPNPAFNTIEAIQGLGVGEALISLLDEKGAPSIIGKALICPPNSRIGPLSPEERAALKGASPLSGIYDTLKDRESAYEILSRKAEAAQAEANEAAESAAEAKAAARAPAPAAKAEPKARASTRQGPMEAMMVSMLRTVGTTVGRELIRGVLGSLKKKR